MPLRDETGGFAKIMRDLTERHLAQERIRESEARFRLLATSIPELVFLTRSDGDRTWGSPQWIEFSGLSLDESLRFGWLEAVHPDDREATIAAWDLARRTGEHHSEQRVRRQSDGEYRWHQTRARPLNGDGGEWVGTMTDIHDLKMLAGRQAVLVAELQHRTRNLLAVVQSIASNTMRATSSMEAFAPQFEGRLRALSRVQSLLARVEHSNLDLRDIVEAELAAFREDDAPADRVKIVGPTASLPAASAQAVALATHELVTNAVKHGALAHPRGKLVVTWRIDDRSAERRVVIDWRESGVPMPAGQTTKRTGYGTELIERALPYQLKAKTSLEFGPDGLRCQIAVPVAADAEAKHD
jgi:PAS domain S-box-containing protein